MTLDYLNSEFLRAETVRTYVTLYGYVDMYQDFGETSVFFYHTSDVEVYYPSASDTLQEYCVLNLYALFLKLLSWNLVHFITLSVQLVIDLKKMKLHFLLKSSLSSARSHPYLFSKTTSGRHTLLKLELNPLNAELNPICHLLALLGAHLIFHVSRLRVNNKICILLWPSASSLLITFSNLNFLHFSFCNFLILSPIRFIAVFEADVCMF